MISLVDGASARERSIVRLHRIRPMWVARSFPGTARLPSSRWTRWRDTCSNTDSVRCCSGPSILLTVLRLASLSRLLGHRGLFFVCADTRDGGVAVGQDGGGEEGDTVRDEGDGGEVGQALSMGAPLIFCVSCCVDCRGGAVEAMSGGWFSLTYMFSDRTVVYFLCCILWLGVRQFPALFISTRHDGQL